MSRNYFSWIQKSSNLGKGKKPNKRKGKEPYRPSFVLLEDRVMPIAYTWIPTAAGTFMWDNAANWSSTGGCALYVMFAVFSFSTGRGIRLLENKR